MSSHFQFSFQLRICTTCNGTLCFDLFFAKFLSPDSKYVWQPWPRAVYFNLVINNWFCFIQFNHSHDSQFQRQRSSENSKLSLLVFRRLCIFCLASRSLLRSLERISVYRNIDIVATRQLLVVRLLVSIIHNDTLSIYYKLSKKKLRWNLFIADVSNEHRWIECIPEEENLKKHDLRARGIWICKKINRRRDSVPPFTPKQ